MLLHRVIALLYIPGYFIEWHVANGHMTLTPFLTKNNVYLWWDGKCLLWFDCVKNLIDNSFD